MVMEKRKQGARLIFLLIYVGVLFLVNWLAFGVWVPFPGNKGLWFYSAAASIILGNLLVTPFYTKPVDALSYAVIAGTGIYLVNDFANWGTVNLIVFWTSLGFVGFVLFVSLIAIAFKDADRKWLKQVSQTCMVLADYCGNQRVIFSIVFLFALIVFHRNSAREMFLLSIAWATIVVIEPDKHLWNLLLRIKSIWSKDWLANEVGIISAYQIPRMILIRQHENAKTDFGTVLAYKDSHAAIKVGIVLNYVGRDETLLLRAIDVEVPEEAIKEATKAISKSAANSVIHFDYFQQNSNRIKKVRELQQLNEIIGIVDQDTTVERLEFEVIKNENLTEGRLVETEIQGIPVIYQIMDGLTKEDIVAQKNKYGYSRATAVKIGAWENETNKFKPVNWLPNINTPVYLKQAKEPKLDAEAVGHFPKTTYNIQIKNIHELVTHNTAILGILGIGKSMLSIELVERMIAEKIKVICIDLTNQYAIELPEFFDKTWSDACLKNIQDSGNRDADKFNDSPESGGSLPHLTEAIYKDLREFMKAENNYYLKVYNPSEFIATKQLSEPKSYKVGDDWDRSASLWNITPVEITSIISEELLKILQGKGITDNVKARVCLVYEEAHCLVPEWSSTATEGDKSATNRTARAILQGRKYGMGCLLITQRTANVTKTILNQCNSIFAMRTFDDTGKAFLANYIGSEYSNRLSLLEARHAVFYGKASSCENPVLIRLNDRKDFISSFRAKYPPPELSMLKEDVKSEIVTVTENSVESTENIETTSKPGSKGALEVDDDLPF